MVLFEYTEISFKSKLIMPANLLFLTGEDDFRLRERLSFYRKGFAQKYPNGSLEEIDEGITWEDFEARCLTPSLFGEKRLFICEGFFQPDIFEKAQKKDFFKTLESLSEISTVLVAEPKPDKRQKWVKEFLKEAKHESFDPMDTSQVLSWIQEYAQKNQIHISPDVLRFFVGRCGENLWNACKELDKLKHFRMNEAVTKEDVIALTLPHPEQQIWDFLAALGKNDTSKSLKMFEELIQQGESVYQILAMVMREIRIYAQLRAGLDEGMGESQIVSTTKLHPFVVKKTMSAVRPMSMKQIQTWYQKLYEIDKGIKTGGFSSTTDDTSEIELALEQMIVSMND